MARQWTVQIEGPSQVLDAVSFPMHRLGDEGIRHLLKTLVLKYDDLSLREVVASSLNHRKGGPLAGVVGEAEYFAQPDRRKVGYALHGPTISAIAWWPLTDDEGESLKKMMNPTGAE